MKFVTEARNSLDLSVQGARTRLIFCRIDIIIIEIDLIGEWVASESVAGSLFWACGRDGSLQDLV